MTVLLHFMCARRIPTSLRTHLTHTSTHGHPLVVPRRATTAAHMQVRRSGRGPTPPPTVASGAELARAPGVREPPAGSHRAALMATRAAQRSRPSARAIRRILSQGGEIARASPAAPPPTVPMVSAFTAAPLARMRMAEAFAEHVLRPRAASICEHRTPGRTLEERLRAQRARGRVWVNGGALTGIRAAIPAAKLVALVRGRDLQADSNGGLGSPGCGGVLQRCAADVQRRTGGNTRRAAGGAEAWVRHTGSSRRRTGHSVDDTSMPCAHLTAAQSRCGRMQIARQGGRAARGVKLRTCASSGEERTPSMVRGGWTFPGRHGGRRRPRPPRRHVCNGPKPPPWKLARTSLT